jgi:hypothetical protein
VIDAARFSEVVDLLMAANGPADRVGCAGLTARMGRDVNLGHAARIQGDYASWQVYQDDYVETWYEYQDLGC